MKYTYKQWQQRVCNRLGHDWAYQDQELYMLKICLRCGAKQVFFPEEVSEDADMDDDNSKEN